MDGLDKTAGQTDAEERPGKSERTAPLPGAGLGDELAHARFAVIEGLGHGRIRLVAAGG